MALKYSRLALPVILLALLLGLSACGEQATATPAPTAAAPEQVSVRLALDWFPNANHAGLFMAVDKGYFEERGPGGGRYTRQLTRPLSCQTVASGADDFGINYQPDLLLARSQGVAGGVGGFPGATSPELGAGPQDLGHRPPRRPGRQEGRLSWHTHQ